MSREEKLAIIARINSTIQVADRRGEALGLERAIEIAALSLAVIADQLVDDETAVIGRGAEK